jgi:hypothetical protein
MRNLLQKKRTGAAARYHLLQDFHKLSQTFREQFEKQIADSEEEGNGLTPLTYAFANDAYQFLTASSENIFTQDVLEEFIEALRQWGESTLGASHVTTPQLRVFIQGCQRQLARDNINVQWHYLWCLTGSRRNDKNNIIRLVAQDAGGEDGPHPLSLSSISEVQLEFNQLLVHSTGDAYSVEAVKGSMNPVEGVIFFDGYLW